MLRNLSIAFTLFFLSLNIYAQKVEIIQSTTIFEKAPFESCHASTLVDLGKGKIMAAWFGGKHEGSKDVVIWSSIKTGKQWSLPIEIANGRINDTSRFACWNPVLFKTKNGILFLHYKVGPNPRTWWAEYKTSVNNGKTWSKAQKLPKDFLGPIKNKPIQLPNGTILYPSSTESLDEKTWAIHIEKSDAECKNWKKININCDTFGVIQPSILTYPNGRLQLLCRSRQNVIVESWSENNGETWSKLKATQLPNPNSGSDAVTLKDSRQLLVYNPLTAGKNWWEGRSVLKLAISTDGENWQDIYTLESHNKGEYSYPAIIQDRNGNIHLSYTAERKKITYAEIRLVRSP
ncbi:exo-alpha-sialidase [Pedobacter sp. ISL-68]|uniref:sialidase family protein n=1 Tax=Pedobacter sp. ISL-68 TaxID=2819165 RepID=UPI001BEB9A16|nr:sialidase family protein [Pedobacter sp. ISL-68]MBT2591240.1 exo-alpha-sialidase [Pedobacter sp. ISL-68]